MLPLISASLLGARRCSDLANPLWLNSRLFIGRSGRRPESRTASKAGSAVNVAAAIAVHGFDVVIRSWCLRSGSYNGGGLRWDRSVPARVRIAAVVGRATVSSGVTLATSAVTAIMTLSEREPETMYQDTVR